MTKAEKTKQFIIEKSAPIFNTKGIAATSMSDLMEATKLAKGSLYVHFENKEALSYSVVDYSLELLSKRALKAVNKHKSSKEKLFAYINFLSDPLNPLIQGGCPILNYGVESDDTSPIIKQKVNKMIEDTQQYISAIVKEGIAIGEFKKDWDGEEFALKTFAIIEGGILISRVAGNNNRMKTIINIIRKEIEAQSS